MISLKDGLTAMYRIYVGKKDKQNEHLEKNPQSLAKLENFKESKKKYAKALKVARTEFFAKNLENS